MVCMLIALFLTVTSGRTTELPPIDVFLAPPGYHTPKLSPDGRLYGIIGVRQNDQALLTVDLTTGKSTPVVKFGDNRIVDFWWKGSDLILLLLENYMGFREFRSYDLRTSETKEKVLPSLMRYASEPGYPSVIVLMNSLSGDPDNVLVATTDAMGLDLWRLNVRTGGRELVQGGHGAVKLWLTDRQGRPLSGFGQFHKDWFMAFPPQSGQAWRQVELGEKNPPDFLPLSVAADQRRIIGIDYAAADTARMVAWNPTDDTKETLWQSPEVDAQTVQVWGDDPTRIRSVGYETDRRKLHYLTDEDRELGQQIDTALAHTTNYIVSTTQDESKMIIVSQSETVPEDYYLFDKKTRRLAKLGSAYPAIKPVTLVPGRYFTSAARDGLPLHGRIYLPRGSTGASPTVLWIGNLTGRAEMGYNANFQLLLSRGFAVAVIDHRGVDGYGRKFAEAGSLQLGGAMADDMVDGLEWLAREGLIDPKRIAVAGTEEGGILAVQTLARYPDRFRAWINFSTPMEIGEWKLDRIVFGRLSEDETKSRAGGSGGGRNYLRSIDPMAAVTRIKMPSFHFYTHDQLDSPDFKGERLEAYLGKVPEPHVFLTGVKTSSIRDYEHHSEQVRQDEDKRVWSELLKFLDQHLAAPK